MLLTRAEMQELERRTFEGGVSPEALMEQAGLCIARAIRQFFPEPGTCVIYAGRGHNGGDALVAARHLAADGWMVQRRHVFERKQLSELTFKKLLEAEACTTIAARADYIATKSPIIFLDGLLGIGASGALREPIRRFTREINQMRQLLRARTISIDIPTGLDTDTGDAYPDCVVADYTLTVGYAKTGLLEDVAVNYVGRLSVLPLVEFAEQNFSAQNDARIALAGNLAPLLPRRKFDTHKTECGRVAIVAGSPGMTGAALMSAKAAVRAGAGLVTLFATRDIYPVLAAAAMPEIMVKPVDSYREVLDAPRDVTAIGPGLGMRYREDVLHLIETCPEPMVIDADALNILSEKMDLLQTCAGRRLLTPHPGEMARLFKRRNLTRSETVSAFTREFPGTLLLKGARTVIGEKGVPHCYNSTGSPGMATGGMGDILTGTCAALIAQGLAPYDAARTGAWLCGLAAELAMRDGKQSEESLSATDLPERFGAAFRQLHERCF